jgi:hypothetical protein
MSSIIDDTSLLNFDAAPPLLVAELVESGNTLEKVIEIVKSTVLTCSASTWRHVCLKETTGNPFLQISND